MLVQDMHVIFRIFEVNLESRKTYVDDLEQRRNERIATPNLPINIIPTNIAGLKLSGKFPMDMRIPHM